MINMSKQTWMTSKKKRVLSAIICVTALLNACGEMKSSDTIPSEKSNKDLSESPTKPNFVFIFADDQSPFAVGAYGNEVVKTPNIDNLAQRGVKFTNAYNMGAWNGAVCMASRAMLNTGLSVWNAYDVDTKIRAGKAYDATWSMMLENAGYDTYMTGKWHVAAPAKDVFSRVKHVRPGMPNDGWEHATQVAKFEAFYAGKSEAKDWREFMPIGYNRPINENDDTWSPTDPKHGGFWEGGKHWSEVVADDAIEFVEQTKNSDKPFFMYLAFNAPHDPRQAPQSYIDMYALSDIPMPKNFLPMYPDKDLMGNGPDLRDAALAPFPRTEYATKVNLQEYYALITHLDDQVGKIVNALESAGLMENTYIVYTADHGLAVGEHGLFGKQNMYEHSVRTPFIFLGPNIPKNKTAIVDIYLQDVMATALDVADIAKPENVFFNSVKDIATGERNESYYSSIYGAYIDSQRMIKKDGYKLIVYPKAKKLKLFHLATDPLEANDLSESPEQATRVKSLFSALLTLQNEMQDPLDISALAP
ncbi:choline-sulfatase [Agaribacter marinus]|uniref:Choline-sulfatase n=2 Tax=Agaribacter marinus TaxID=1431249 RepID=A0AA37WL83_9ALTE|nr:choline-sulfatase [Agaribacter marinus]